MKIIDSMEKRGDSYVANYYIYDELETNEQIRKLISGLSNEWEISNINLNYINDHDTFNPTISYDTFQDFIENCVDFPNKEDLLSVSFNMANDMKVMKGEISMGNNIFHTYEEKKSSLIR